MEAVAFRMMLNPGQKAEYARRHDDIWPERVALLKSAGVTDHPIWLNEETNHIFGILKRPDDHAMNDLPKEAIMRKRWDHMTDIMAVGAGNIPAQVPLAPRLRHGIGACRHQPPGLCPRRRYFTTSKRAESAS